jgi:hypothetical protein
VGYDHNQLGHGHRSTSYQPKRAAERMADISRSGICEHMSVEHDLFEATFEELMTP